jgi:hypothetical protein
MSDREVEVSVQAEGVDDAAGELSGESMAEGPEVTGAGGQRQGSLASSLKGGIIAGLLIQLKSVTNILEPILSVLNAFLAPIGLIVQRLLQPVLRQWLKLLPLWFKLIDKFPAEAIGKVLGVLAGVVVTALQALLRAYIRGADFLAELLPSVDELSSLIPTWSEIQSGLRDLRSRLVQEITSLPSSIGSAISDRLPNLGGFGGGGGDGNGGLFDGLLSRFDGDDSGGGGDGDGPIVNLEGGLGTFVDRFTKNPTFDFP